MKIKHVCSASAQKAIWVPEGNEENINNTLWRDEIDWKATEHVPMTAFVDTEKNIHILYKLEISWPFENI
jgi:hypothetical protein